MSSPDRRFTGPVKWITLVVVAVVVLALLFTIVFPWIERNLSNPTLGLALPPLVSSLLMPRGR